MELEHQHDRRLPDTDSEPNCDGVANGHTGYPNSNADSSHSNADSSHTNTNTNTYPDANTNSDPGYSNPNSDPGVTNSDCDTNSDANSWPDLHGDVRQSGVDHDCGHAAGDSLPIEHHGGGCE